jgi:ArsR family transcriptional regulator
MKSPILDEHTAVQVAELFRAFSDTSRVRILSAIIEKEVNISALAELVGVTKSAVSHHMRGLRQMRLVKSRREGKEVYYSVDDPHIIALFQQGIAHVSTGGKKRNRSGSLRFGVK